MSNLDVKNSENAPILYIGTDEAAKFLSTKSTVIRQSRHTGNLFGRRPPKHYKIGERKVLYKVVDLEAWVESAPQGHIVGALKIPEQPKAEVSTDRKIRSGDK